MFPYKVLTLLMLLSFVGSIFGEKEAKVKIKTSWSNRIGGLFDRTVWKKDYNSNKTNHKTSSNVNSVICHTNECNVFSNELLGGMDLSVNPCEDFYQYTCGKWAKSHPIPKHVPYWSQKKLFQNVIYRRMKEILRSEPRTDDILPVRLAKKWFRSCIDEDSLEERGLRPLESILTLGGGWPMVMDPEEWDVDENSWQSLENYYFQLRGSYTFYKFEPPSYHGSNVQIRPGELPLADKLPLEYRDYLGDDYDFYLDFVLEVATFFAHYNKANVSRRMLRKDTWDLVEFEKQLYTIANHIDEDPDSTLMPLNDFIDWYEGKINLIYDNDFDGRIKFYKLMEELLSTLNIKLNKSMKIIAIDRPYFIKLTKLLADTPKRTIINYMHWHFVTDFLPYTTEVMSETLFSLMKNEYGIAEKPPRWLECLEQTRMTDAAAYAFVQKYFPKDLQRKVTIMIYNIRDGVEIMLNHSNWMTKADKKITTIKLRNTKISAGFPDWYKNRTAVVNSFKGLTIGYDFLDNVLSFRRYKLKSKLRFLRDVDMNDQSWYIDALSINAFHGGNEIVLPAAIFQPPLFTQGLPEYINYGSTGTIIGHEIGHAFDPLEFRYGGDYNTLPEATLSKYRKQIKCFEQQYNNQSAKATNKTSNRISVQAIADATGIQSALKAYKTLKKKAAGNLDPKLPGFEQFTNEQMFFIIYGASWCENMTPRFAEKLDQIYNEHNFGRVRVNGAVSNMDEFGKAFKCPKGSPMNRDKKCYLWRKEKSYFFTRKQNKPWPFG